MGVLFELFGAGEGHVVDRELPSALEGYSDAAFLDFDVELLLWEGNHIHF